MKNKADDHEDDKIVVT